MPSDYGCITEVQWDLLAELGPSWWQFLPLIMAGGCVQDMPGSPHPLLGGALEGELPWQCGDEAGALQLCGTASCDSENLGEDPNCSSLKGNHP